MKCDCSIQQWRLKIDDIIQRTVICSWLLAHEEVAQRRVGYCSDICIL